SRWRKRVLGIVGPGGFGKIDAIARAAVVLYYGKHTFIQQEPGAFYRQLFAALAKLILHGGRDAGEEPETGVEFLRWIQIGGIDLHLLHWRRRDFEVFQFRVSVTVELGFGFRIGDVVHLLRNQHDLTAKFAFVL